MLSVPGVGEALFSITSSPTDLDFWNFPLKVRLRHRVAPRHGAGAADPSGSLWQRLPGGYGLPGKDLVFIAGGIGLAPLRSVIRYVRANRSWYGQVDIVYGARSGTTWWTIRRLWSSGARREGLRVHLTIDREQPGWDGHVGFVPGYVRELGFDTGENRCGLRSPVMIQFTLEALQAMGFQKNQVYTTLELRMKCGIGKCGRCNIGDRYVCRDGPVFRCDQLDRLPDEY